MGEHGPKTPEQPNISQPETPEAVSRPILSESDREVLNIGLHTFKDGFEKMDKDQLPTVIIFPETSARPLYYAIAPIVKEVYAAKGAELPTFHFLNVMRNPEREELELGKDADQEAVAEIHSEIKTQDKRPSTEQRTRLARATGWTSMAEQRLREIINASPQGNLWFVDDFFEEGETIRQLEGVKAMLPNHEATFFAFFNGRLGRDRVSENHYSELPLKVISGLGRIGLDRTYKALWDYNGFAFGKRPRSPWKAKTGQETGAITKESVTGVVKPNKPSLHVEKSPEADSKLMKQLRDEMADMAKKVLTDTTYDREKAIDALEIDLSGF